MFAAGIAAGLATAIVAGCGPFAPSMPPAATSSATSPTAASGEPVGSALLLLATVNDAPVLALVHPTAGITALPVPDPSTMAVTALGDGSLVALLADGRAFAAPRGPAGLVGHMRWRPLDLRWNRALPVDAIIFAAAASPDGKRLAAIARPPLA